MFRYILLIGLITGCGPQPTFTSDDGIMVWDYTKEHKVSQGDFEIATTEVIKARGKGRGKLDGLFINFYDDIVRPGIDSDYNINAVEIRAHYYPCYEGYIHELCHHLQWEIEKKIDGAHLTGPYWTVGGVRDEATQQTQYILGCSKEPPDA